MTQPDPTTIGRYKVLHCLGAGAMGAVYLCQDPLLKRKVAVKVVLNTRVDSEVMKARFQRESEISAQLNHPNVITIYDVGEDEVVGPFLAMEFVEGGSLQGHLTGSPPDVRLLLDWMAQLGRAVVAAEAAGITHRDIKPANMLLSKDGRLKLTDFGLARNEESNLTQTGMVMGTPSYTAPELLEGAPACAATDRWAFAVTTFQVMTGGRLPHDGDGLPSLLYHILNEPPIFPEGTPAPVVRVFIKALHRDPTRRYDTILSFLEALAEGLGARAQLDTRGLAPHPPEAGVPGDSDATRTMGLVPQLPEPVPSGGPPSTPSTPPTGGKATSPAPGGFAPPGLTAPPKDLFRGASEPPEAVGDLLLGVPAPARAPAKPPARPVGVEPRLLARAIPRSTGWGHYALPAGVIVLLVLYFFVLRTWTVPIRTVPPGVTVELDGKVVGVGDLDLQVRGGKHRLRLTKEGFEPVIRTFEGSEDLGVFKLLESLPWCNVITDPSGAEVWVDGKFQGQTPLKELTIPAHEVRVEIRLQGYQSWKGRLARGRPLPEPIVLTKR